MPKTSSVQITASTTKPSKLKEILQIIEAAAAAGLPILLALDHNPETEAEVTAGVEVLDAVEQAAS